MRSGAKKIHSQNKGGGGEAEKEEVEEAEMEAVKSFRKYAFAHWRISFYFCILLSFAVQVVLLDLVLEVPSKTKTIRTILPSRLLAIPHQRAV